MTYDHAHVGYFSNHLQARPGAVASYEMNFDLINWTHA